MPKGQRTGQAFRREVIAYSQTHTDEQAAKKYRVHPQTIYGWRRAAGVTKNASRKARPANGDGAPKPASNGDLREAIREQVRAHVEKMVREEMSAAVAELVH